MLQVRLTLEEPEPGVTIVNLTHTDIPEEDRWVLVLGFFSIFSFSLLPCVDWLVFGCRYGNSTVVENTERGWRDLIFHKIRAVFGFGI